MYVKLLHTMITDQYDNPYNIILTTAFNGTKNILPSSELFL